MEPREESKARFNIEELEERIAPAAGAIGIAAAAGTGFVPEGVLPETPCPDGLPDLPV